MWCKRHKGRLLVAVIALTMIGASVAAVTPGDVTSFELKADEFGRVMVPPVLPGTSVEVIIDMSGAYNPDKGPVIGINQSSSVDIFEVRPMGSVSRTGIIKPIFDLSTFVEPTVTGNGKVVMGFTMPEGLNSMSFNFKVVVRGGSVTKLTTTSPNPAWWYNIKQLEDVHVVALKAE